MFRSFFLIFVILVFALVAQAQSPSLGMFPKAGYGPMGLYTPDAVSPYSWSINPATTSVAMAATSSDQGAEVDYLGIDNDQGPYVSSIIQTAYHKIGRYDFRVSHYNTRSDKRPALITGGAPLELDGEALELTVSRLTGNGSAFGLSMTPQDKFHFSVGDGLISGSAESRFQARFGAVIPLKKNLTLGVTAGYERDRLTANYSPLVTGLPNDLIATGKYSVKTGLIGLGYVPWQGGLLSVNHMVQKFKGPDLDDTVNTPYYSMCQYLNRKLAISASYLDGGRGLGVNYTSGHFQIGGGYTWDSYRSLESCAGKSDAAWAWITYTN